MPPTGIADLMTLEGSRCHAPTHTHADAEHLGAPPADHPVRLVVVLRPQTPFVQPGAVLSRADYLTRHCARPDMLERLRALAKEAGLTVVREDALAQSVILSGPLSAAQTVFRPESVGLYRIGGRQCLGRHGGIAVPPDLAPEIVAIMGYDERPIARPHFLHAAPNARSTRYTPPEVAARYGFPGSTHGAANGVHAHFRRAVADQARQTIGLIELGGGYDPDQMARYFTGLGVNRTGGLVSVSVDGASNAPDGDPNGADGEVQLDIQVAGAIATAADIAVYFAPNRNNGFYEAITTAIHDTTNAPEIISISWGGPESSWSVQDMNAMDQAFQAAAALGITVCAASGDNGANDGTSERVVDFPASSPHVLACGGTTLPQEGTEVAWNDGARGGATGGGYSSHFNRPTWQSGNTQSMRGVPDVAGNADPETGYAISVDGQDAVIGGTSAVAPLWAALIALCNAQGGRKAGLVASVLYGRADNFNDIVSGDNDGYRTSPGWDPVTGLGSPRGAAIAATLAGSDVSV